MAPRRGPSCGRSMPRGVRLASAEFPPLLGVSRRRRRGRVAEGGGLLNRYTL